MVSYSPLMNLMIKTVTKASKGLVRDFYEVENLQVSQKGPGDFVSMADRRTEEFIKKELLAIRPDYSFLFEESGEIIGNNKEYRFIVDPLDGTNNFLHSLPYFCITIALEKFYPNQTSEIIAAVTYAPILQELYWAEKGQGVWFENNAGKAQRIRVAKRKELSTSLICVGSLKRDNDLASKFAAKTAAIRCIGSGALALAYVASGKMDAFISNKIYSWDIAAGTLFVNEAGGKVSEINGNDKVINDGSIIAANSLLNQLILQSL